MTDELLKQFEDAQRIVNTGKDAKGHGYSELGILNQAAWIGEHSGHLTAEIKRLRGVNDRLRKHLGKHLTAELNAL